MPRNILANKFFLFLVLVCTSILASEEYEIVIEANNPEISSKILEGLEDFNREFFHKKYGSNEIDTFVIYAKDSKMIGGVCGYFFKGGAESFIGIDYLWVEQDKRLQGIGTALLREVEAFAREHQCDHIQLFTWGYQAADFYRKLGFECMGVIPSWIDGYDALFFRKRL